MSHAQCLCAECEDTRRDAARYAVLRDHIEPRVLYDKMARRYPVGAWRDLRPDEGIREKVDNLCDLALSASEKT